MSIGDLALDSMFLLVHRRYDSAMCLAMNALDATAQREYPELAGARGVGERIRRFVCAHYDIITVVGTGGAIHAAPASHLGVFDPQASEPKSLEAMLYTVVRCYLTHEAKLPPETYFNEQAVFGKTSQRLSIPVLMAYAVVLAVVGAKTNADETSTGGTLDMMVMGRTIPVGECWGDKDKILTLLGISSADCGQQPAAPSGS